MTFELRTGLTIIALVVLVFAQIMFLLSRIRVNRPASRKSPVNLPPQFEKKARPQPPESSTSNQGIHSELFSKFQENLNLSNQDQRKPNSDVILSISSQGKQKSPPPASMPADSSEKSDIPQAKKAAPAKKVGPIPKIDDDFDVEPLGSIFDDVQEPLGQDGTPYQEKRTPSFDLKPDISESDTEEEITESSPETEEPIRSHEFLTSEDFAQSDKSIDDDTNFVISVVRKQLDKKEFQTCLAAINQYLKENALKTLPKDQSIELLKSKATCEFEMKLFEQSVKTWQVLFKNFIPGEHTEFVPMTEDLVEQYKSANQPQYMVHFLFSLLNEYRKTQEFTKMDEVYQQIEDGYEQMKDWKRLIQTYENHLSIKKSLDDFEGQLELLDHLGKVLYDQGDAEGSRKCYEQRLAIENKISSR